MKYLILTLLLLVGIAYAAVTIVTHETHAVRQGTRQLATHSTQAACRADARARLEAEGQNRTTGSNVYSCVTTMNYIGTFKPNPVNPLVARLSWVHDGNAEGFRVVYGRTVDELINTVQINSATTRNFDLTLPANGTWYFGVKAFRQANESVLSNLTVKTIP